MGIIMIAIVVVVDVVKSESYAEYEKKNKIFKTGLQIQKLVQRASLDSGFHYPTPKGASAKNPLNNASNRNKKNTVVRKCD